MWGEYTKDDDWQNTYSQGWNRLRKLRSHKTSDKDFEFDVLLANPPFAGDIKETRIIHRYELGKKATGKYQSKVKWTEKLNQ
jgi:type I restriction enzyme M protein